MVVSYLEQDTEKLDDVSITGLADAVRWVDKLLGAFNILLQKRKWRCWVLSFEGQN